MDSGRRNDENVGKLRQVFRGHSSNAINNVGLRHAQKPRIKTGSGLLQNLSSVDE